MRWCASVRPRAASGLPRLARVGIATVFGFALWLTGALLVSPASEAQGLFQSLFGGGSTPPSPQPQQVVPAPRAPGAAIPFRGAGELGRSPLPRSTPGTDAGEAPAQGAGTYRTVCVRLCDGFFFPVSSATTRRGFYRDASLCRSRCGDEGRLFFAPAPGVEIAQMRDLTGRSYPALSNAFVYRKRYVPSCRCRPEPWSAAEVMRHARYAAVEDAQRPRAPLVGLVVSRPAAVLASATIEPPVPSTMTPASPPGETRDEPGDRDRLMPRPGLTTGAAAAPPAGDPPAVPAKPVQSARKPAGAKVKAADASKKSRAPALPQRPAPARQPAVAGAPRQVWPGDRPG